MNRRLVAVAAALALVFSGMTGASAQPVSADQAQAALAAPTKPQVPAADVPASQIPSVHIVPGSTINLVSRESNVPVRVQNDFDSDVTVHVHMSPSNPRVIVPNAVAITVPAHSAVNAKVPVQAIANGKVFLIVWLTTFSGLRLGKDSILQMNVNADIELAMLIGFGAIVIILGTFGAVRTVRKNRRKHQLEAIEDAS